MEGNLIDVLLSRHLVYFSSYISTISTLAKFFNSSLKLVDSKQRLFNSSNGFDESLSSSSSFSNGMTPLRKRFIGLRNDFLLFVFFVKRM